MKSSSRRSFLKRIVLKSKAATIALPLLESMGLNTLWAASSSEQRETAPQRIVFIYIPNGVIGKNWFPKNTELDSSLPSSLQPLTEVKEYIATVNGLNRIRSVGEPHQYAGSCWLTSSGPMNSQFDISPINTTLDQMIAERIGNSTPFKSLELSCNGFTDNKESRHFDSISWYAANHEAKSDNNPRQVFKRLFGRVENYKRSILDTVINQAQDIKRTLSGDDQKKIDEYLYSVRSIEKRTQMQQSDDLDIDMPMPEGIPRDRGQYIRLMGDLMAMALQTDRTRVASLMIGPERWSTPLMFDGVFEKPVNHHTMTHDPRLNDQVSRIDRFHVEQFVYIVKKLKSMKEGQQNLLDQTYLILGSGLGNGNEHSYARLPVVIAGKGGVDTTLNRNIHCKPGTPLANLWLTLANQMGVEIKRFADSTGSVKQLV